MRSQPARPVGAREKTPDSRSHVHCGKSRERASVLGCWGVGPMSLER